MKLLIASFFIIFLSAVYISAIEIPLDNECLTVFEVGNQKNGVQVNCPGGYIVTGGGWADRRNNFGNQRDQDQSRPLGDGSGWYCLDDEGSKDDAECYAVCCNENLISTTIEEKIKPEGQGVNVYCPENYFVVGGGFWDKGNNNDDYDTLAPLPSVLGWRCAEDRSGFDSRCYAVCAQGQENYQLSCVRETAIGNQKNGAVVECPQGYTLTGGGFIDRSGNDDDQDINRPENNGWYCAEDSSSSNSECLAVCCRLEFVCIDNDGDGYNATGEGCGPIDCDDSDLEVYPGADDSNCDGIDNDCDSVEDEDYTPTPTSCGMGACYATGQLECQSGSEVDTCTPGTPAADDTLCNGIDDDCNGQTDEDYVSTPTSCGVGECADTGLMECIGGSEIDSCTPGIPSAELCDNLDNDCDGSTADDGTGEIWYGMPCDGFDTDLCEEGIYGCDSGNQFCSDLTSDNVELCNGLDDDCDGQIPANEGDTDGDGALDCEDNCPYDLAKTESGICGCGVSDVDSDSDGYYVCEDCDDNDLNQYPGAPEVCDGADNDCDGLIDEGLGTTPTNCGVGECASAGELACIDGAWVDSCTPGTPSAELCDNLDNDCDGFTDQADSDCFECQDDGDCSNTECNDLDGCYEGTYRNYHNVQNICDDYFCTQHSCIYYSEIETDNDGDGYDAECDNDCDDADDTIYPGATELCDDKDNDCDHIIDEGCFIKKLIDKLPRKKFLIKKIRTNKVVYDDEVKPGDQLFIDLQFENIGREDTRYATIRVTQPELGISMKLGPFIGPEVDEVMSRGLYLEIPENAEPGVYTVRITLSNLEGIKRIRHRDFRIT